MSSVVDWGLCTGCMPLTCTATPTSHSSSCCMVGSVCRAEAMWTPLNGCISVIYRNDCCATMATTGI